MDDLGSLIEKSVRRGFPEMLNRSIPPNTTVLEVGCGTGQLGNFLSIASRRVLSVDACLNSLRLAQAFKERHVLAGVTFAQMNLFRLPLRPSAFDVVICTGVLHHTSDPAGGFRGLVPLVKPGGHIVVGLYNRFGRLQTRLRRVVAGVLGERVASLDPYLREYRVTADKRRSWFMDQYRNPHESLHTMDELLRWFDAAGIRFVRAFPPAVPDRDFGLDYHASIFDEDDAGSFPDRVVSQLRQMLTDKEGGLFVMIGRRDDPR
jgi:SAM-dependent methyltransferase